MSITIRMAIHHELRESGISEVTGVAHLRSFG